MRVEQPAERAPSALSGRRRRSARLDLVERLRSRRPGGKLELHEQRERRPAGKRDVVAAIGAVLAQDLERAAIHVLDGAASIPRGSRVRQVASTRRAARDELERLGSDRHGTSASAVFGAGDSVRKRDRVMTPSVPSDPMKRSIRSMSGAA